MPPELELSGWPGPAGALAGLAAEALLGYPTALHRRLPHPVVGLGAAISGFERRWNQPRRSEPERRALGLAAMTIVAGGAGLFGWLLQQLCAGLPLGLLAFALLASVGLAQRSLYDHVGAVLKALDAQGLSGAREAVGGIVGRDVRHLDAEQVSAAALESLAESFNDGVVAPAFWLAVGGLPGLFVYKAVNTGDSLIGHMEPRWRAFGWAAARTDDVMNWIPARLAGVLVALAGPGGFATMLRDAHRHASPNAGWPEAAMAGALRVRLGGPACYDGQPVERPVFGAGPPPKPGDLARGLRLYQRSCVLLFTLMAIGALAWAR